ncbi:MAG TPA: aspartate aminotransferase family protein [Acidimicrobiia bacterium]|nr:aspartate aminotransferase family protein [Acidimicrobiia bacterium]
MTSSTAPRRDHHSADLRARASSLFPGGVNSNVRLLGPPVFFKEGKGSRLWDVDGNEYIDYLLGQGPNFLGHAPEGVLSAVAEAVSRGMVYGAQHVQEVEAGERMLDVLGWADQIRFGVSGTEAVQIALRVSRAATGRDKFVRFTGHYHGWLDNVLAKFVDGSAVPASRGQLGSHLDDSFTLPWNDLDAVERLLDQHADDIAAILMEPVMFNAGSVEPRPGYLEGVRAACDRHGVVLIFDEVISGFRIALGGAAERYGVAPDLATYGKAMAGGWPVSALAGRSGLMDGIGTGEINHSGTFNASVMACAAVVATIDRLTEDPPYETLGRIGESLKSGLAELASSHSLPLNIQGLPMAFHAGIGEGPVAKYEDLGRLDADAYQALVDLLIDNGVWVAGRGIWYVSAAHTEQDVEETLSRADEAMRSFVS